MNINANALVDKLQSRDATREPLWVRYTLITIALIFFLSCLLLPLILVFVEAFKQGLGVYTQALVHPDTLSAVKLTLLTAAIAVPLNVVFGVPQLGRWQSLISVVNLSSPPLLICRFRCRL